ncbi:unnamed protein product, partial [Staurois parvus]
IGPPTDPGPSGSARVSKWSVCPCFSMYIHHPTPCILLQHIHSYTLLAKLRGCVSPLRFHLTTPMSPLCHCCALTMDHQSTERAEDVGSVMLSAVSNHS